MRRRSMAIAGVAACSLMLAACGSDDDGGGDEGSGGGTVGVILPDSASSDRWETRDRPLLEAAFDEAGVESDIQNAQGDKNTFQTIADGMIASGVDAMLIVNLDSESGGAVINKAQEAGIPVIDYDRLTLGGGASYYVSFDNVAVGTEIGNGLVQCLADDGVTEGPVALLNGSPTDNNATLFNEGYKTAIEDAGFTVTAEQAVPDWDNTQAGTIFEQMYTEANGDFVGVAAANDGLGGAVVSVLDRNGVAGQIPVTGQDATTSGLQRVLLGTQCVTVYKAIEKEADAASQLAILLAQGDTDAADALATGTVEDTESGEQVPSVLLEPQGIFQDNVQVVVDDGFATADELCTTDELQAACDEFGVS
jgi:D-xylose transport system substrate-binding protein